MQTPPIPLLPHSSSLSPPPSECPLSAGIPDHRAVLLAVMGLTKISAMWNLKLMPFLVCVSGPRLLWPPLLGPCPPAPCLNPGCLCLCPLITSAGPRVLPERREVKQLVLRHNAALA